MNLSEFKAWFEGFTENLSGTPNKQQWARIVEKIGKIKDAPPTVEKVFIDYWERPWRRWFDRPYYERYSFGNDIHRCSTNEVRETYSASGGSPTKRRASMSAEVSFDSGAAFRDLGRAEAKSMKG